MSTTTTNYGLIKPGTDDPILVGQLNDNADTIDATMKSISDALDVAKLGIKYKGEVYYYSDLPSTGNQIGDAYTVKYSGTSGTTPDGTEYVWGTVSGTNQWINFSKDSYTKAEVDALLALKQNALTTTQLAAANSGINSTKVEQIETNKNNISWLVDTGVKNLLDYEKIKAFNTSFTWSGNTGTYNGVTIKIESNAVKISASNTSASVNIYISLETDTWKNGNTYRLMGVPQASVDNVDLNIQSGSPNYYTYYTKISNQEVTFPNVNTRIRFSIASGATFSEVTIPLMMCSVAAYSASSAYQPYALSNAELTAKEQANENNISSILSLFAGCQFFADMVDKKNYFFTVKRRNGNARYRYGLFITGNTAVMPTLYSIFADTNNSVTITKLAGDSTKPFTGTLSYDSAGVGTLGISVGDNVNAYGGLRGIWFD